MTNFAMYRWDEKLGGVYSCTATACDVHRCKFYTPHPDTIDTESEACDYFGIELSLVGDPLPSTCHSVQAQHNALTTHIRKNAVS